MSTTVRLLAKRNIPFADMKMRRKWNREIRSSIMHGNTTASTSMASMHNEGKKRNTDYTQRRISTHTHGTRHMIRDLFWGRFKWFYCAVYRTHANGENFFCTFQRCFSQQRARSSRIFNERKYAIRRRHISANVERHQPNGSIYIVYNA